MKQFLNTICGGALLALLWANNPAFAGNDSKRGSAGAAELLLNPWSRSSGMGGANTAGVRGIEAANLNIAGLAYTKGTEFQISGTRYLSGTDISFNALGFSQRIGEYGVLGITVVSMRLGNFIETTLANPEGTGNTFTPSLNNIGVGYSQVFSKRVTAGVMVRLVDHTLPRAGATGVGVDAGVQYQSDDARFKFGVAMRNWGPKTMYTGEGFSVKGTIANNENNYTQTLSGNSSQFEIPSQFNIGSSYDFKLDGDNKLTTALNFMSNSFTQDQVQFGTEYSYKDIFMLRTGYTIQNNMFSSTTATDLNLGPSAGCSINLPVDLGKNDEDDEEDRESLKATSKKRTKMVGLNYSYRSTAYFFGTHTLGLSLSF
jgi:hypothetical protein